MPEGKNSMIGIEGLEKEKSIKCHVPEITSVDMWYMLFQAASKYPATYKHIHSFKICFDKNMTTLQIRSRLSLFPWTMHPRCLSMLTCIQLCSCCIVWLLVGIRMFAIHHLQSEWQWTFYTWICMYFVKLSSQKWDFWVKGSIYLKIWQITQCPP